MPLSRVKQTVNSVPGPHLLKSDHFPSWCLSFLIYIKKLRLLIFSKLRFPGSIPRDSPLAGPGAAINFTSPALWRSLMRRSCGLYPGKTELRVFLGLYHSLAHPHCVTLDWSAFCTSVFFCPIGMEIPTSQVATRVRTHVVKAPQEMETFVLCYHLPGVRACAGWFIALSDCVAVAIPRCRYRYFPPFYR